MAGISGKLSEVESTQLSIGEMSVILIRHLLDITPEPVGASKSGSRPATLY